MIIPVQLKGIFYFYLLVKVLGNLRCHHRLHIRLGATVLLWFIVHEILIKNASFEYKQEHITNIFFFIFFLNTAYIGKNF